MDAEFHYPTWPCFFEDSFNSQSLQNHCSFFNFIRILDDYIILAMSSHYLFCYIRASGGSPGQFSKPVCSCTSLSARAVTQNMAAVICEDIVSTLTIDPRFILSSAVQVQRASMLHLVHVSNKLAASDIFSDSSWYIDSHSLLLQSNKTKQELIESKNELKDAKDEKKVLLSTIKMLKAEHRYCWV